MTDKLLGSLGTKLTEGWSLESLAPASIFWAGGLVAIANHPKWQLLLTRLIGHISSFEYPVVLQFFLILTALYVVAASAFIVKNLNTSVLRFMEGYWPHWMSWIREKRVSRHLKYRDRLESGRDNIVLIQKINEERLNDLEDEIKEYYRLNPGADNPLPETEKEEYIHLTKLSQDHLPSTKKAMLIQYKQELREMPRYSDFMPTRLGNLLRSSEYQSSIKYGLDAVICWPRLWLLLPKDVKQEISKARTDLDSAARFYLWSLLFMLWGLAGVWWAIPVGATSASFSYSVWAMRAARSYGLLIEATFDTYRHLLYNSARWYLPTDPSQEISVGRQLSEYFRNGKI